MFTQEHIQEIVNKIVQGFHPDKVILYGSYAYGEPTAESDIDLLIIMSFEERAFDMAQKIRRDLHLSSDVQLNVKTPEEIQWRYNGYCPLVRTAIEEGKVCYERSSTSHPRVA